MRRSGAGCFFRSTCLNNNDRLAESDLAGGRKKRSCVAHRLHIKENALRVGIVAEVINKIAPSHVEHGSCRDDRAEANLFLLAPIENRGLQRTALAEKCDATFFGQSLCEGCVEPDGGIHEAHTVWADQSQ